MSRLYNLTQSLYSWEEEQFKLANIQIKIDPSLPENIYGSLDGIAFDGEKVWVRSSNRDHILWLDDPEEVVFYELFPFSNVLMFPSDFKGGRIDECKLLEDYVQNKWEGSKFFTLPLDIGLSTTSFRGVEYQGLQISSSTKRAYTKKGLKGDFLFDWRKNVSRHIRPFCDRYKYKEGENDKRSKEEASNNPHWPYRPSIENGFVRYLEKTPIGELRKQLLAEIDKE